MTTSTFPTALLPKLHAVAQAIEYIEKRGDNEFQHYKFVKAVDVVSQIRDALLSRGVVVVPGAADATHLPYGSKGGHLTTVALEYNFTDVETGQTVRVPWVGVGADTGGDKGIYKAYTGGLKYALLSLFLVPTTDDPERDNLTSQPEPEPHPDDARPAAPRIPLDRMQSILQLAIQAGVATLDMEAAPGTAPVFNAVFKAKLAIVGVSKIGELNVDQAEMIEAFLREEQAQNEAEAQARADGAGAE